MRVPVSPSAAVPAVLALTLVLAGPSFAQQPPAWDWPDKAKNLKVLPSDTPKDQLRETMMVFTRSLGVRCTECHVGEEGKPLSTFDFPSDKNPKKGVARDMMKMVGDVRADLKKMDLQGTHRVAMGCVTCHHGRPTPATLVEELGGAGRFTHPIRDAARVGGIVSGDLGGDDLDAQRLAQGPEAEVEAAQARHVVAAHHAAHSVDIAENRGQSAGHGLLCRASLGESEIVVAED
jgi:hypothetical protein